MGCCTSQLACCCGPASCGLCCSCLPAIRESTGTRAMYTLLLTLGFLLQCLMQLTNWYRPGESDLNRFGLNWAAVWVKMVSSWVCIVIYLWTLFFPRLCFGRNLAFPHIPDTLNSTGQGEPLDNADGAERGQGDAESSPRRPSSSAKRSSAASLTRSTNDLPRSSSDLRSSREALGHRNRSPERPASRGGKRSKSRSPSRERQSFV